MIIRLSQKISSKVKAGRLLDMPLDGDPILDWSTQTFAVNRIQFILISNTKSLYSCVIPGKGVTTTKHLVTRLIESVTHQLYSDSLERLVEKLKTIHFDEVQFAKSLNRSVIGSMNEQIAMASTIMKIRNGTLLELNDELNDNLMSILGAKKGDYGIPKDAIATY